VSLNNTGRKRKAQEKGGAGRRKYCRRIRDGSDRPSCGGFYRHGLSRGVDPRYDSCDILHKIQLPCGKAAGRGRECVRAQHICRGEIDRADYLRPIHRERVAQIEIDRQPSLLIGRQRQRERPGTDLRCCSCASGYRSYTAWGATDVALQLRTEGNQRIRDTQRDAGVRASRNRGRGA
jgi:hypothetical protein